MYHETHQCPRFACSFLDYNAGIPLLHTYCYRAGDRQHASSNGNIYPYTNHHDHGAAIHTTTSHVHTNANVHTSTNYLYTHTYNHNAAGPYDYHGRIQPT